MAAKSTLVPTRKFWTPLILCILFLLGAGNLQAQVAPPGTATNKAIPAGSYIIDMGVLPQTINNGLIPYGLVYELVSTQRIPIEWAINPAKAKDGVDFTHNSKNYRGGPFIILAEFRTPGVETIIADYLANYPGLTIDETVSDFTAPIYITLDYVMRWTLDEQNGGIAEGYLENANIPIDAYDWVLPGELTCCNDVFVMPHADPEWNDGAALAHGRLFSWNADIGSMTSDGLGGCDGAIWAACHAVSALEAMFNPAIPSEQTNFLAEKDFVATGANNPYEDNALILWGDHDGGTRPPAYVYEPSLGNHPIMQFLGRLDDATENGSEQIYLPYNMGWRPSTDIAIWDDDHPDRISGDDKHRAAKVAFGEAFGDPTRGYVMYEAGHSHNKGGEWSVAAQRAFFNFSFFAAQTKAINVSIGGVPSPAQVRGGTSVTFTANATGGTGVFNYEWISSCPGTFSNPFGATTTFTPALVTDPSNCIVSCIVTDDCGTRVAFGSEAITVVPGPAPPVAENDTRTTFPETPITVNAVANDSDPNLDLDPTSLVLTGEVGGVVTTVNGGTFVNNGDGTVTYTPPTGVPMLTDQVEYTVCDMTDPMETPPGPYCDVAIITINVANLDENGCLPSETFTVISKGYANLYDDDPLRTDNVNDPDRALGVPDGDGFAKLAKNADPANRGMLTLDLGVVVPQGDTIFLYMASDSDADVQVSVQGSADNITYSGSNTYTLANNRNTGFLAYNYVVTQMGGVRYVKITHLDNIKESVIDAVEYSISDCVGGCSETEVVVTNTGSATTELVPNSTNTAKDPNRAVGPPDESQFSELDPGEALFLDMGVFLPEGSVLKLYMSSNGDGTNTSDMTVSVSTDDLSYSGNQTFNVGVPRSESWGVYTYTVPAGGARYVRISAATLRGFVDAVEYIFFSCLNAVPTANNDAATVCEDYSITYQVQANDTDPQGLALTTSIVTPPAQGTATANPDGSITYQPPLGVDFSGSVTITYQVCNTNGLCDQANLVITVEDDGCGAGEEALSKNIVGPQTVNITSQADIEDTFLDGGSNATSSEGTNSEIKIKQKNNQDDRRGLLQFNLAALAGVPEGTITSATLRLTATGNNNNSMDIGAYLVTEDWDQANANWFRRLAGPVNWATEGGTVEESPLGLLDVNNFPTGVSSGSSYNWDVTQAVQLWQGGVYTNFGILLRSQDDQDPNASDIEYKFASEDNNTAGIRPRLIITYTDYSCTGVVCVPIPNQPPLAVNDMASTPSNQSVIIDVQDNDSDPEGQPLTTTAVTQPPSGQGTVTINPNGTVTYDPMGFLGTTTFTYTICDPGPLCDDAVVTVTTTNVPPVAQDDDVTTTLNTPINIDVLADNGNGVDSDPEGQPLTVSLQPGNDIPDNGFITLEPNGTITYTPLPGFYGTDSFEYTVCDSDGLCDVATVTVTIPNNPPTGVNDVAATGECQPVLIDVTANDTDPEGGELTVGAIVSPPPPSEGTVAIVQSVFIEFTPAPGFTGTSTFTYTVCDDGTPQACSVVAATVTVTVSSGTTVNTRPVAGDDIAEDIIQGQTAFIPVQDNDSDPEGDDLITFVAQSPAITDPLYAGTWSPNMMPVGAGTLGVQANGNVTFTPINDFIGTVTFNYLVCEDHPAVPMGCPAPDQLCDEATVTVTVVNQPPAAINDFAGATSGVPVIIPVLANDTEPDGDALTITNAGGTFPTANGSYTINNDGTITYTPNVGFTGTETFAYEICDVVTPPSEILCDVALVTVTVTGPIDLELSKSVSPMAANVGDPVTFTLTVTNTSTTTAATLVSVRDKLPAGLTYVSDNGGGAYDPGSGSWFVGTLAANGGSATLIINATVAGLNDANNVAQVTNAEEFDVDSSPNNLVNNTPAEDDEAAAQVQPNVIDLELSKSVDELNPNVGSTVLFTLTLDNMSSVVATGVAVEDLLPAGFSNPSNISNGGTASMGTVSWSGLAVPANGSISLTFEATVDEPSAFPIPAGEYTNQAQVTASNEPDLDSDPASGFGVDDLNDAIADDDEAELALTPKQIDLELTNVVDVPSPNVGDMVNFTITVTNTNDANTAATNISVEGLIPGGLDYDAASISFNAGGTGAVITTNDGDPTALQWTIDQLDPGESVTLTFSATVLDPTAGSYLTDAQVTAHTEDDIDSVPNDGAGDDRDTEGVTPQQADLLLSKTVSPLQPNVGDPVTFTITVTNLGPNAATNVDVEDYVPAGYSNIVNISDSGTESMGTVSWSIPNIPAFGSETLTFQATVDAPTGAADEYQNIAQVTAADQFDPNSTPDNLVNGTPAENDEDDATATPQQADLALAKSVMPMNPNVGQTVTFTITLTNAGPNNATGVAVEDYLPNGYSGAVNISNGGSESMGTISWSGLTVPAMGSLQLTFEATVEAPGMGIDYTNVAQVTDADQFDPNSTPDNLVNNTPAEDDEGEATATPQQANLTLTKSISPATANPGDPVTFTIALSNGGPDAATGVAVEDYVPAGFSSISNISNGGSESGGTVSWNGLSVAASGNLQLTFDAVVDAPTGAPGEYRNVAQVTAADQYDPTSTPDNLVGNTPAEDDEDDATLSAATANLLLSKSVNTVTPNVGDEVTFTIQLINLGPDAATGVDVEDYVPAGYSNINTISNGGIESSGTITWPNLSIPAPGGGTNTLNLTFKATVDAPTGTAGEYRNVAQVTDSDQFDPTSTPNNLVNNTPAEDDEDDVAVNPRRSDLSLAKTVMPANPNVGDLVTFTITISNAGPNAASGVAVQDVVPTGYSGITNITGGGSAAGNVVTWSGLAVPVGPGTVTLTFQATVDAPTGAADEYKNVAQITDADQYDPDSQPNNLVGNTPAQDDEAEATATPQQSDLELLKLASDPAPNVGDVITFTVRLNNLGPDAATGVAVEDIVPSGFGNIANISNGGTESSGTVLWTGLTVPAMGMLDLTFEVEVLASTIFTDYRNVAEVTDADQYDPNSTPNNLSNNTPAENDEDDLLVEPQQSDLSLEKLISDATPDVGQTVTFTINLSNDGPDAASGVSVEDIVPQGFSAITNISNGGMESSGTITWANLSVPVGTNSLVLTFDAIVDAPTGAPGEYANTAEITAADQYDPDSDPAAGFGVDDLNDAAADDDEDSVTAVPNLVDVAVQKFVSIANPNVGQTVTFTISVSNAGSAAVAATGIVVEDVLPAGYAYVPGSISSIPGGTGATITPNATGAPVFTWSINQLDPGESVILTLQAVVQEPTGAPNEYLNAAQVTDINEYDTDSTPGDGMGDDYDTESVTPKQIDVSLTNTVDDPTPAIGQTVAFTVAVTNGGPNSATNITVEDLIPTGYTYVGGSIGFDPNGSGATITTNDGNTSALLWTINQLDPGETVFLTFDAVVDAPTGAPNEYLTIAEVIAHTEDDVDSVPNDGMGDDYDTEGITLAIADVQLTKDVDITAPFVGQTVTFFLSVSNNANGGAITDAATGIVVEDALPSGYTYVPGSISSIAGGSGAIITTDQSGAPTLSWTIDQLDPGENVTLTFQAVVLDPTGAPGEFMNAAEVVFLQQQDLDSEPGDGMGDDYDTETVTPINAPPVADDDSYMTDEDTPLSVPAPGVLSNDSDPDMDPLAVTVLTPPSNGTLVQNPDGSFTYTPDPDFNGVDTYTYEACDPSNACDPATVTITVNPVDDQPVAEDDMASVPEDGSVNIDPLPNDDFGGDGPSTGPITIVTPPGNGTATVNDGGTPNDPTDDTIDYAPNPDYNGPDQIVYEICDADGDCDPATIDITVDPVNDLPDAVDDPNEMTAEDTPVNIDVLFNDTFGGDGPSTGAITVVTQPTNGTATVNDGGTPNDPTDDTVDYTPNADYNGTDQFTYEICDSNGDCDQAVATITIDPVDDFPSADDDLASVPEDGSVNIDPLPNDDFGGDGPGAGPITIVTPPGNGTATVNDGGTPNDPTDDTIDYTPDPDYNGPDQIVYEICDADGDCVQATIDITVTPVNDLPDAVDDPNEMTAEDTPVNIDVLANDDFGGDGPSTGAITIVTQPANGTATVNDGGTPNDPTDDTVDYTPNADYNGTDQFTYEICDSNGDCDQAVATITIDPVDDFPSAANDMASVPEDGSVNINPLPNDDFGGDGPITGPITIVTPPGNGTATVNDGGTPNDPTDDTIDYTPDADYNGPDQIVYEICDADGDCVQATIDITVTPVNDLPDAVDDPNEMTAEDTPVNIDVLANDDFGGDGPSTGAITIVTPPTNGMATVNDGGTPNDPTDDTVDYTPNADYNGTDQFTYEICDSNGDCDQAVATITIDPVDDFPSADDDMASVPEDGSVNIDPLPNDDFGGDGPSMTPITIVTPPLNGTATVNDGGTPNDPTDDTIDYTPAPDYNGPDQIVYEICDFDGDCVQATIDVTVDPVDDFPVAEDDMASTDEDTPVNIDPLPNDDFGGDGPSTGTINILTPPANGTATVNDGGTPTDPTDDTIDYTPAPDYSGPDQLVYEICDADGDCDPATIDITVNPVNDVPDAVDDPNTVINEDSPGVNIDVLANDDFGGDGPSMSAITIVTPPTNGTATVDDNGTPNDPTDDSVDYVPNPNFNGTDMFTYEICDSNGDCDQAVAAITVNPVNDLPNAVNDPGITTAEDTPLNIDPLINDTFGGDGPSTGTITIEAGPINGTGTVNDGGTPNDPSDDTIDYTPNPNFSGNDLIVYQICDSNGDCDQATISIIVTPVDDMPVAEDDMATVPEDGTVNVDPLANDDFGGDGPILGSIQILTPPMNGTATVDNNGTPFDPTDDTIDYTPDPDYNGPDQLVYQICDGDGDCDPATITFDVTPVNDFPTAVDEPVQNVVEDMAANIDPLPNDDFGGDGPSTGTITIVTPPTNGTATVNDGGTPNDPTDDTIDYTPNANYNGLDQIEYEICDSNGDCDQAIIPINVAPANDFPTAADDMASTDEDTPLNIDPLPNDDFGGDGPGAGPITIVTPPANGTATVNDGGTPNDPTDDTIDYTPAPDYNGPDQIVYEICDADGNCDQATIDITVDPVNDLPDAVDDPNEMTAEDTPVNIDVLFNDTFGGDGPSTGAITIVTPPTNGTATVNDGGTPNDPTDDTVDYIPNADYNGPDQFTYEICDSNGDCDQAVATIDITPVDDFPTAADDMVSTNEDSPLNIDPLPNDDFGGDGPSTGTITIVTPPANGTATVNDGGTPNDPTDDTIDYTPDPDYNGPDQIVYEICDADGDCDPATIDIEVAPVNDLPDAVDDPNETTMEDTPVNIDVLFNDTFGGDGPSTGAITIVTPPTNGTAVVNDGGTPNDPTDDTVDYTPNADYNGPDQFTYEICDSNGDCDQAVATINITPEDDFPSAADDMASVPEDGSVNIDPLPNDDFGGDGPSVGTITIVTPPGNGTATVNDGGTPNDPTDDTIDYTPDPDYNGPDQIVYEICDFDGDCVQATIDITVDPVNDVPVAEDDMAAATEDTPLNIDPLPNDDFGGDGPSMGTINILTPPTNGTATVNDGGTPNDPTDDTIDYTPDPDYNGPDQIVYEICDANGDCDPATIDIQVAPANDLPDAVDDPNETTMEDMSVNIDVLANDDFGGDGPSTGAITVTVQPTNGTAVVNDGGTPNDPTDDTVDYTPDPDFFGTDQFTYEICDSNGDCDQAVATIDVTPVNDLPSATDDMASVPEDGSVNIDPLPNDDFGGDGPGAGPITIVTPPANGTATVDNGGTPNDPTDDTIDYTPDPDYNGPDQIVYEICDANGDCVQATIDITVDPQNDVPVAVDDPNTVINEDSPGVIISVLNNDDFGGDGPSTGTITVVTQPTNGTATVNDGGTPTDPADDKVTYVPDPNFNGTDQFTYEICDSDGDCDQAVATVTVNPINDFPNAVNDSRTTPEDTPININALINDTFGGDGPSVGTIAIIGGSLNGTSTVNDGGTPNDPTDDTIDYTPNPNFSGIDQIVYEICDSNGDCDVAIITVTITPVDDMPIAEDDMATVPEDGSVNVDPLANDDFGGDGPSVGTIQIVTPPVNGTATVNNGGTPFDPTDDTIDYTPDPDYNGPDQLTYRICDVDGDCDPAIITFDVTPVNDLPTAVDEPVQNVVEDMSANIDPLPNDDFGGDGPGAGTITIVTQPTNGTATVNDGGTPNDPTDDTIDYTPNANYNGLDQIEYEICDSNGDCDQAIIPINVGSVNDFPFATDDMATVPEDGSVNIDPLPNDDFGGDGPSMTPITIVTPPMNGTATVNDGGTPNDPTDDTIDYTPDPDYNGPDQIVYEICDANGNCDQATIDIDVTPVNDLPDAVDDPNETTDEDTPVNIDVLANDDFGGDGPSTGAITIVTPPTNGTATVNDGGTPNDPTDDTVDYIPNADYFGPDQFTYEICDSNGDCDQAVATIDIQSVDDFPTAGNDVADVPEDGSVNIDPLPNDDFGGDGPSVGPITIVTPPGNGTATVNDGGTPDDPTDDTIDYTPAPDYNGPDQIVYEICDEDGDCVQATIDITVDPVNDLPDAMDDPVTVTEDIPLNIDPLPNDDFGGDGPSMTPITIVTPPTNGTATVNDGGTPTDPTDDTIDYTPDPNYNGPDQIVYEICDSNGDCDQATIDITVDPVNEFPDAVDDPVAATEDTPLNIDPLPNDDFGGDGPSMTPITIVTPPANGTATVNDGGTPTDPTDDTIDYTPDPDYNGPDQIVYEICDSNGDCDQATIDITVDPVNDLPDAMDDPVTVTEDIPLNIDPLPNDDFGGDGPSMTPITIVTPPTNGTATVNDGGTPTDPTDDTIDYTPDPNYNGPDQIVYEICDSNGDCDQATIDITVDPVNEFPDAVDDPNETTMEDMSVNIDVLANDDFGGDGPSTGAITIVTPPTNGTATVNDGGTPNDPTDDTVDYTPNADYFGPDQFTYEICDSDGDCDQAVATIDITPVNDLPSADDDMASVPEDGSTNIDPLPNDDFGGDGPATGPITIVTPPANGTATVDDGGTPNDPTDDTIDYTPAPDYNGPDQIVYEICDANGDCVQATIDIDVTPENDLPDAVDDPVTALNEDSPGVNIDVLNNDTFGGDGPSTGTITIVTPPLNGTATVNDGGTPNDPTDDSVDYVPNANYNGPDQFTYEICDSNGDCDQAVAPITVNPVNDFPNAVNDLGLTTPEDTPLNIDPLINDTFGGDGPSTGTITITVSPLDGTATVNNGGTPNDPTDDTIDYVPDPNFHGNDLIVYEICDSNGDCDEATISITVTPVDDFPVAEDDMATVPEDGSVNVDPLPNDDFGGDGPILGSIQIITPPTNGTATVNNNGTPFDPTDDTINYTPAPDYNGPDQLVYQICDADGDCDPATITFDVTPVNDLPDAQDDPVTATEDTPLNIDPLTNDDFGGDGPSMTPITIVTPPTNGTATVNDGGTPNDPTDDTIDYTPAPDYNGPDQIVYEICDSNGDCVQATIDITVDPANDLPTAEDDVADVIQDTPANIDPLPNDDFGGDGPSTGTINIVTPPTNGTATVNDGGTPNDPTDDTIDYTPDAGYSGPDQLTYEICDSNGDCDPAVISINVLKRELQVEKVGTVDLGANNTLDVGDVINYQITVENTGDVTISNIVVTDPNADGGVTDCAPFTLLPGESMVCNAVHTITAADISAGSVTNTATATGQDPNGTDVSDDSDDPNDPTDADPDQDGEPDDPTVTTLPCVTIEAWVYLEGAAIDPSGLVNYTVPMRTDLNDLRLLPGQLLVDPFFGNTYTPAGQPYSIAPWNYFGTEGDNFDSMNDPNFADAGYPSTVADWVLVSLRDNPNGTGGPICQAAALLHNDGRIEFVDEFSCCTLDPQQSYYLVIEHRNHLIVMSHEPIDIVNNTITYDFRAQQSYLVDPFGFGFVGQKEILPGVWAMHAGNGNQTLSGQSDTDINFDDRTYWEGENGELGQYRIGDYNLNGDTNFNDRIQWELNNGKFTSVPRD